MKEIHRIVITGGPCAGKTTAFARIESELSEKGYKVFVVPETFTEMYNGGIKLLDYSPLDFQTMLLKMQIAKEDMYYKAAELHQNEKVVILYDRGTIDALAYMNPSIARLMLDENGYRENMLKTRYDAVIHMVTAADGAVEAYLANKGNNKARYEDVDGAIAADKALIPVWTGHSHLRLVDNSTDFDTKITRVMNEIYAILGQPIPLEIERKYLIEMPNGVRLENERLISKDEYLDLLNESDYRKKQITKTRYCFVWNNMYFELDVYPQWDKWAILEVELTNENNGKIKLPEFFKMIKDVTDDEAYSNYNLASRFPE